MAGNFKNSKRFDNLMHLKLTRDGPHSGKQFSAQRKKNIY